MARSIRHKLGVHLLTGLLNPPIPVLYKPTRFIETLAFKEVRSSTSTEKPYSFTAFILHGLLGSGRNWRSFSRILSSSLSTSIPPSEWRMVLVDLRNHGKSANLEGLHPPHDIPNAAKDLANLVKSQGWAWPDVVIGHSMGGKVALQYADSCARGDLVQLPKQALRAKDLDEMFPIIDPKAKPTTKPKIFVSLLWKQLNHLGNASFDPATFRVDQYGNFLYYHADPASPIPWNVYHWGGLTVLSNLRILQWQVCKKTDNKLEFLFLEGESEELNASQTVDSHI